MGITMREDKLKHDGKWNVRWKNSWNVWLLSLHWWICWRTSGVHSGSIWRRKSPRASTRFGDRYFGDYQRDDHLCPELRKMWCHWRLRWLHKSLQHRIIDGAWYPPDW